jgi:class 3 adenylate cyclase
MREPRNRNAIRRSATWRFDGIAPDAIWRSLADTARFNEAARLPPHEIVEIPRPDGSVAYFGRGKQGPFRLEWEELPVNWVSNRWFEHQRIFSRGPIASLTAYFTLDGDANGSTGVYTIEAAPAGPLGWAMLHSGALFRGALRSFTKLADDARDYAAGRRDDPFHHPPPALAEGAPARIDALIAAIEATPYGHGLAHRLGDFIRTAQDVDMTSIRPLALARCWGVTEGKAIDCCLQAVRSGLLDMQWNILCPRCRIAKHVATGLDRLPTGAHCGTCNIDYERDFARNVEAVFRPSASIRPTGFGEYCLFGPMSTPHIKLHVTLEPGTARDVAAGLAHGAYRLRTLEPGDERDIDWQSGGFPEFRIDAAEKMHAGAPGLAGEIRLVNDSARRLTFIVEDRSWVADALTADRLTTRQTFRDLFSAETLRPGDDVGIARIVLMFTDLKGSTALYERVGDAAAYRRVRDHFAFLAASVRKHDGALVKTIGDAVMAAFSDPANAIDAALEIQREVATFNAAHGGEQIVIKLGLHCGPTIAVTLNDRLDYFGTTVNLAARLQGESRGGDIVLSTAMLADAAAAARLAPLALSDETARLKGFDAPVPFHRIVPAALAAAGR